MDTNQPDIKDLPAEPSRKTRKRRWRPRLVFLLLLAAILALLVFIPVPIGFLKGKLQAAVLRKLGIEVSFQRAWVTLAAGRIEFDRVVIRDPASPESEYRVNQLEASGPIEGFLTRTRSWPDFVYVAEPDPIHLEVSRSGLHTTGSLSLLLDRIDKTVRERREEEAKSGSKRKVEAPFRPAVRIRGAVLAIDSPTTPTPLVSLTLNNALFFPGPDDSKDYRVEFAGVLGTGAPASAMGSLRYYAADHLWNSSLGVDNLEGTLPSAVLDDRLKWRVERLEAVGRVTAERAGGVSFHIEARSNRVQVAALQTPTVPLFNSPLSLTLDATVPPNSSPLKVDTLRLTGPDLDVTLGGSINPRTPHEFRLDLAASRCPRSLYEFARKQLDRESITFDLPTTSGLQAALHVEGNPDQLTSSTVTGRVRLDRVRVRNGILPDALSLEQIDIRFTGTEAEAGIARWQMGGLGGSASATMSGLPILGRPARVTGRFEVDGQAGEIVPVARSLHLLPSQVEEVGASIRGDGTFATTFHIRKGHVVTSHTTWGVQASWIDGLLRLAQWQDAIRMESGQVQVTPRELEIVRLRTATGGTDLRWSGKIEGHKVFWNNPTMRLHTEGEASIPSLARILDLEKVGVAELQKADGTLRVNADWEGSLDDQAEAVWRAQVMGRGISFPLPLRGDTATVHNLDFDAEATSRTVVLRNLQGDIDDITLAGTLRVDDRGIELDSKVSAPVETALRLFRRDLAEFRGYGRVPVTAKAGLTAQAPLPSPELPVVARWAKALARPGAVGLDDNAPVRPFLAATLYPDGAAFWHEEMPQKVTNIRGRITADLTGLQIHNCMSKWGDVEGCIVSGQVFAGHFPIRVQFDIQSPRMDIMSWITGWGAPEDGKQARSVYVDADGAKPPLKQMTVIDGVLRAKQVTLNRLQAQNGTAKLHYEHWRSGPNYLTASPIQVQAYDGTASGSIALVIREGTPSPQFKIQGQMIDVDLKPFATDLLGREGQAVGRILAFVRLNGQFNDFSTYQGEGSVMLSNTRVFGGPVFPILGKILKATVVQDVTFSTIRGGFDIGDQKIQFERLFFDSPGVRMVGEGSVGFLGSLDMTMTVGPRSQTLSVIPGMDAISSFFRQVGAGFLKFHVKGTLEKPDVAAVPFSVDVVERLFSSAEKETEKGKETKAVDPFTSPTRTPLSGSTSKQ